MHHRKEQAINDVFQAISESEVDITIPKGPNHFSTQFILQALDVITLIPGDVIRKPINRQAEAIIGGVTHAEKTTDVRAFQLRVTMPMVLMGVLCVLMMVILSMIVVMIIMVIVMVVIILP